MSSAKTPPNHWTQPVADTIRVARLDAEHFRPEFVALEKAIKATKRSRKLDDLLTHCKRGQQPEYVSDGDVLVINSQHVGAHFINLDEVQRTSLDFWKRKPTAHVKKGDVLVNSTGLGTIGRVNHVFHDAKTVVDNHVTILRVDNEQIRPAFLSVFLNSDLGRQQTYKWQSGSSGQLELYPDDIRRFLIVVPPIEVQIAIEQQLMSAWKAYRSAAQKATAAEQGALDLLSPGEVYGGK